MIDRTRFDAIRQQHGHYASWAVWAEASETPKSNVGDMSIFDVEANSSLLATIKGNVVMVGRLFVADRGNSRIQIFDQDGKFLNEWTQFGRPSGIFIDKNDVLYSADSESGGDPKRNPPFTRGISLSSRIPIRTDRGKASRQTPRATCLGRLPAMVG
jgi:hypothetical protein